MTKIPVLFLADTSHPAKAVLDHIKAITSSNDTFEWHVVNPLVHKTLDKLDFSFFNALGIHYSIKPYTYYYLSKTLRAKIANYTGLKFQFLQDEYQKGDLVQEYLCELNIRILFTLVRPQYLDKAYPNLKHVVKVPVLTGYVGEYMKHIQSKPIKDRTIDVSYRARRCEYWLGTLAYEKQFIADEFVKRSKSTDLKLNISLLESDRLYGEAWFDLLKNSKAVLGTESGASIWDCDGSIEKKTTEYLRHNKKASFTETYDQVLKKYDHNIVYSAISPRIFEAAATKTPMILFPGDYSDVCQPDTHYIPLEKDFSNIEEVLAKLKDIDYLENLANQTYYDLIESDLYSERLFSQLIEKTLLDTISLKTDQTKNELSNYIESQLSSHKTLNLIRRLKTETCFIISNFIAILCDSRTSLKDKITHLLRGVKRYITYLIPKVKGSGTNW